MTSISSSGDEAAEWSSTCEPRLTTFRGGNGGGSRTKTVGAAPASRRAAEADGQHSQEKPAVQGKAWPGGPGCMPACMRDWPLATGGSFWRNEGQAVACAAAAMCKHFSPAHVWRPRQLVLHRRPRLLRQDHLAAVRSFAAVGSSGGRRVAQVQHGRVAADMLVHRLEHDASTRLSHASPASCITSPSHGFLSDHAAQSCLTSAAAPAPPQCPSSRLSRRPPLPAAAARCRHRQAEGEGLFWSPLF